MTPSQNPLLCGLLCLPEELLAHIFTLLETKDLYSLMLLSKQLNHVVSRTLLAPYGISIVDSQSLPQVKLADHGMQALPVLASCLFVTSIEHLSCTFNRPREGQDPFGEIYDLLRLLAKLSNVSEVELNFLQLNDWDEGLPLKIMKDRMNILQGLFGTIVQKNCTDLKVLGGRIVWASTSNIDAAIEPPWNSSSIFSLRLTVFQTLKASLKSFLIKARKSIFKCQYKPASSENKVCTTKFDNFGHSKLKAFVTNQSTILLHPLIIDWTLQIINSSPIEHLSLGRQPWTAKYWNTLLRQTTLPSLKYLHVSHCQVELKDIVAFLTRHPKVETLFLFKILASDSSPFQGLELPYLKNLAADPSIIASLFASKTVFATPSSITIILRNDVDSPADVNRHLEPVSHRIIESQLTVQLYVDYWVSEGSGWMDTTGGYGIAAESSSDAVLRHVRILELSTAEHANLLSKENGVELFPDWLAFYFPVVEQITFDDGLAWMKPSERASFFRSILAVCPEVNCIAINSVKYDLAAIEGENMSEET